MKSSKILEFSVIVPVYNSQETVKLLVQRIEQTFAGISDDFELIMVDDCSADASYREMQDAQAQFSFLKIFQNQSNLGQAYTSLFGIEQSRGKFIVTIDDDLEYDPEDIIKLHQQLIVSDADVVFGLAKDKYRLQGKSTNWANFRNKLLNLWWNKPITDSFKIFKRALLFEGDECLCDIPFEAYINKLDPLPKIDYAQVNFHERAAGQSNYSFWKKLKLFYQMNKSFKK